MDIRAINEKFKAHFGVCGEMFTSPGRINLIGEHTDYNGGFVFPGAIDKGMVAEIKLNDSDKVRAYAVDLDEYAEFGLREEDAEKRRMRVMLASQVARVINRSMKLLGIDVPQRM